jgi:serine/threonine protein kinase
MSAIDRGDLLDGWYRLDTVLGRGAVGVVWKAWDLRLDRDVAIKVLRPELAAHPATRQRFEEEARSTAGLSHPAVVAVYDTGDHDSGAYLVMECLSGRTLSDELADGNMLPQRVRQIAVQVLGAVEAAHNIGIIHRDIKPSNILLTASNDPKLADFGIAKTVDSTDLTSVGEVIGTPMYLAPERLAGAAATPATDLYSLGVVLYECYSGTRLFEGSNVMAMLRQIQNQPAVALIAASGAPDAGLASVIKRAIAVDPAQRFSSASEMRAALNGREYNDGTLVAARPDFDRDAETVAMPMLPNETAVSTRLQPSHITPGTRTRTRWIAAIGVLVLVIVIGILALQRPGSAPRSSTSTSTVPPSSSLPPALEAAMRNLENSVGP